MTNIFDLFKRRKPQGQRDLASLTRGLAKPALHVLTRNAAALSHFGGAPNLPGSVPWPEKDGRRLAFLARISLAEVHRVLPVEWLPAAGALLFFYDVEEGPWGFDPKDRGGWAVLHVPDLPGPAERSIAPAAESPLAFRNIGFGAIESLPSPQRDAVEALGLSDEESDDYPELCAEAFGESPQHQISGFPSPIQNDTMELKCQLVSNGLYCGDSTGYHDVRAVELGKHASRWRLLFQIDTDEELGAMWGDCGTLYYWIPEEAARAGDFSAAWLVLQCS